MSLRQNTSEIVPVILHDGAGNPKTGVTPADLKGYIRKCGSAAATSAYLVDLTARWIEVDSTKFPGMYEITLTATDTNAPGILAWCVQPVQAGAFQIQMGSDTVIGPAAVAAAVWDALRADHHGSGTFGESDRWQYASAVGHVRIQNNQLAILAEDGSTLTFSLKDIMGNATNFQVTERIPAP